MKKLFIIVSLIFILPFIASAASFVITPSSGSYINGDIVNLNISVDPAGSTIYTAMFDAKFSSDIFEVVSFTLNDSMLAMKQAGYDSIDNVNGVLIKTGGYAGGISSVTSFGKLVLKAKGNGTGTFIVDSSSKLLDSNNANKQTGSQSVSFTIASETPAVKSKVAVKESTDVSIKTVIPKEERTETKASDSKLSDEKATLTQVAAVGQSGTTGNVIPWALGILAVLVIGYIAFKRKWFKSSKI